MMKRLIAVILVILMMTLFAACKGKNTDTGVPVTTLTITQDPATTLDTDDVAKQNKIGFCLSGDKSFHQQLIKEIQIQCQELGYEQVINTALTVEDQIAQLNEMIASGVSAIVLDPVDVDSLETALADYETNDIPVINIVNAINGIVSTLITPDYMAIGKSAGKDAVELFGSGGGQCLLLKTDYDSFSMQLMTDGFLEEIGKDKDVTLYDEEYCGDDEEKAFEAVKMAILGGEVDFIFAQSDTLALGALRALKEFESSIKLVAFGADMELIKAASDGAVYSCIFFGPKALAKESLFIADRYIKNPAYMPPQYIELKIEAAQGNDAPQYYNEDELYAETKGE